MVLFIHKTENGVDSEIIPMSIIHQKIIILFIINVRFFILSWGHLKYSSEIRINKLLIPKVMNLSLHLTVNLMKSQLSWKKF